MTTRRQGRVKFYDVRRGFGFIVPDDGGADVFVHHTAVSRAGLPALLPGMRISFELAPSIGNRPPQADRLLLLPDDEDAPAMHDVPQTDCAAATKAGGRKDRNRPEPAVAGANACRGREAAE